MSPTRDQYIAAMMSVEGIATTDKEASEIELLNRWQDQHRVISDEIIHMHQITDKILGEVFASYGFSVGHFVRQWNKINGKNRRAA